MDKPFYESNVRCFLYKPLCFSCFSCCYNKIPDKNHLRKERFILAYDLRGYSLSRLEALGGTENVRSHCTHGEEAEMNVGARLTLNFLFILRLKTMGWFYPFCGPEWGGVFPPHLNLSETVHILLRCEEMRSPTVSPAITQPAATMPSPPCQTVFPQTVSQNETRKVTNVSRNKTFK